MDNYVNDTYELSKNKHFGSMLGHLLYKLYAIFYFFTEIKLPKFFENPNSWKI